MIDKLALKRLTASDLTFFAWHFKHRSAGNQKAINLNADVFKDQFYPSLEVIARNRQYKLGVDLWVAGPAVARPLNLQRKIIKGRGYKNWRLDGEFIHNPTDEPDRFNVLAPGDLVLLGFEGELSPDAVTLVFLANAAEKDEPLVGELSNILGRQRMISLEPDTLRSLCERLSVSDSHPVWQLVMDDDFIEAGAGIATAVERVLVRSRGATHSLHDLHKARQAAEHIGRFGEELVDTYLQSGMIANEITDYEWVSDKNAIAPHDFRVLRDKKWEKLEVKSTTGSFSREYHLPRSELRDMASGNEPYRIGRVYECNEDGAKMRISRNLQLFGETVLEACRALPPGVAMDAVTVTPDDAVFGSEITLSLPDDKED